jgi:predicted nuclease of predicted toxin-antitoxin system
VLTDDKDFGELIYRQHQKSLGVIFLRLAKLANQTKADVVARVPERYASQLLGAFTTVTIGNVRIRRPPQ